MPGDDPGTPGDESGGADPVGSEASTSGAESNPYGFDDVNMAPTEESMASVANFGFSPDQATAIGLDPNAVAMAKSMGINNPTLGDLATLGLLGPEQDDQSAPDVRKTDEPFFVTALTGLLETLGYLATLGIVDIEMTGKDVFGKDVSRGLSNMFGANVNPNQPIGVEIGLPIGAIPGLAGLGISMAAPTVSIGEEGVTAYGGILGQLGQPGEVSLSPPSEIAEVTEDLTYGLEPVDPLPTDDNIGGDYIPGIQMLASNIPSSVPVQTTGLPSFYSGLLNGIPLDDRDYGNIYRFAAKKGGQVMSNNNYKYGGNVQEYGLGGIVRNLLPIGLGYLAAPYGGLPAAALAGGIGSYVAGGGERSISKAITGALLGLGGGATAQLGTAAESLGPSATFDTTAGAKDLATKYASVGKSAIPTSFSSYAEALGKQGTGLSNLVTSPGGIGAALRAGAIPLSAGAAGLLMSPTRKKLPLTEARKPTQKTPEERQALAYQGLSPFSGMSSFTPPNIYGAKRGGKIPGEGLESGSFVLPADVVSHAGDGNTDAGFSRLNKMFGGGSASYALGGPIKGPTSGLDDLRQTTINGRQAAALSDGEFVVPRDAVSRLGNGSNKQGAEKLYNFMNNIRLAKTGKTQQPQNSLTLQGLRSMMKA